MAVSGVDGFIVGPYDLTSSMGIPGEFSNLNYLEVMNKIREDAKEINVSAGVHIVEPDNKQLKKSIDEGYKFIGYSIDIRMLDHSCRSTLKSIK